RESGIGGAASDALRQPDRPGKRDGRHRLRYGPARQGPENLLGEVRGHGRGRAPRGEAALGERQQRRRDQARRQESGEEGGGKEGAGAQSEEGESQKSEKEGAA